MTEPRSTFTPIRIAIAICLVIACATAALYVVLVRVPADIAGNTKEGTIDLAKRIGNAIDAAIHVRPKVTVTGTTVVEGTASIAELSTIERSFNATYILENTHFASTKRLELKGYFVAKAGYDLTQPFSIDISLNRKTIKAKMPPARINSVDMTKFEVLRDKNGFWNTISAQDREDAVNALLAQGKNSPGAKSLVNEADAALMSQLEVIVRKAASPGLDFLKDSAL